MVVWTQQIVRVFACVAFAVGPCGDAICEEPKTDERNFDATYQRFVDEYRAAKDPQLRLRLVKRGNEQVALFLRDKLKTPEIETLLPKLVKVRLIDLDDAFATVIDEHPNEKVQALALLCFAKYCGNNGRDELSKRSLAFLAKKYGRLRHKDSTFGKAAEEAFYFLTKLTVGKKAPKIAGTDADGVVFRSEDYRGKVVMLRFWGDWCPACRAMFDYERDLVAQYSNQPFALIGVNSDSLDRLKSAQQRSNLTWRTIWDGGTTHGPISMIYRVQQWPTIVVIDAEGIIRYRSEGLAEPQLNEVLKRYMQSAKTASDGIARK